MWCFGHVSTAKQDADLNLSRVQYAAFKEGYSFNTLLEGQDLRDSLRVKRNGDNIKVQAGKTLATVGTNGAKTCMVSLLVLPRPSSDLLSG